MDPRMPPSAPPALSFKVPPEKVVALARARLRLGTLWGVALSLVAVAVPFIEVRASIISLITGTLAIGCWGLVLQARRDARWPGETEVWFEGPRFFARSPVPTARRLPDAWTAVSVARRTPDYIRIVWQPPGSKPRVALIDLPLPIDTLDAITRHLQAHGVQVEVETGTLTSRAGAVVGFIALALGLLLGVRAFAWLVLGVLLEHRAAHPTAVAVVFAALALGGLALLVVRIARRRS